MASIEGRFAKIVHAFNDEVDDLTEELADRLERDAEKNGVEDYDVDDDMEDYIDLIDAVFKQLDQVQDEIARLEEE